MILDFHKNLKDLTVTITLYQQFDNLEVRAAKAILQKQEIDVLPKYGINVAAHIFSALIGEIYHCKSSEEIEEIIKKLDMKELNDLLSNLESKIKTLDWNK